MEKYLFTDRMNAVREVQSQQELQTLIDVSEDPLSIQIWIFRTQGWINLATYRKNFNPILKKTAISPSTPRLAQDSKFKVRSSGWLKQFLVTSFLLVCVFLVYNFARIKWVNASPVSIIAARPDNVPVIDIDSLINEIEFNRGSNLDKTTRTNLRIRNSWPERLVIQLTAKRDSNGNDSRFYDLKLSIDNSTGYMIDLAQVKLISWKAGQPLSIDTMLFNNVNYALATHRKLDKTYKGDSLSLSFEKIRAKSFNFCYSADVKQGNFSDRWFCKE